MADSSFPTMLVVGAMKCGTTAMHDLLAQHPEISMAPGKEVNYFYGPEQQPATDPGTWWRDGQWHRGPEWYASLFDPQTPVRGESSPGYTAPGHPEVAVRIAALLPDVRLVYLVRDPVDRAVSQWRHHRREGTERRPVDEAIIDRDSQYLARSRYHERIAPFLQHFAREQLLVVAQEDLLSDRSGTLRRVYQHVGADPDWCDHHLADDSPDAAAFPVRDSLRAVVWEQVAEDAERLAELVGADLLRRS